MKQAEELVDSYLKKSTADAVILGGDFNAPPILKPGILHSYLHLGGFQLKFQLKTTLIFII